jgi:enamine deaminase RidA (YjgF/YER057c/UK114 family)
MNEFAGYERKVLVKAPKDTLPYSTAIGSGPFVFISGLVGRDPDSGAIAKIALRP